MSEIKQEDLNLFLKNLSEIASKLGEMVETFSALNQVVQESPKILKQEATSLLSEREKIIDEAEKRLKAIFENNVLHVKEKGYYNTDKYNVVVGLSARNRRKTVALIVDRESGKTVCGTSVICDENDTFNREIGSYLAVRKLLMGNLKDVPRSFTHFEEREIPLREGQVVQHTQSKNIFKIVGRPKSNFVKAQVLKCVFPSESTFPVGYEFDCRSDFLKILEDSKNVDYDFYIKS